MVRSTSRPADGGGDLADQTGADHGAVRLVEHASPTAPDLGVGHAGVGHLDRRRRSRRRRPGSTSAARRTPSRASSAEPQAGLDDVAADGDPLRLGALGHEVVRDAGGGLAGRRPAAGRRGRARRRAAASRPAGRAAACPRRRGAPGRRTPRRRPARSVVVASSQRTVASGQCRRFIVATAAVSSSRLDREHLAVERGERHRVRADAAAEVGDPLDPGGGEPLGVPGRDRQPGGLLQAGRGEEHARRRTGRTSRRRPRAAGTGSARRRPAPAGGPRRAARSPSAMASASSYGGRDSSRAHPSLGEQRRDALQVHRPILARWSSAGDSRAVFGPVSPGRGPPGVLALELTEC